MKKSRKLSTSGRPSYVVFPGHSTSYSWTTQGPKSRQGAGGEVHRLV